MYLAIREVFHDDSVLSQNAIGMQRRSPDKQYAAFSSRGRLDVCRHVWI